VAVQPFLERQQMVELFSNNEKGGRANGLGLAAATASEK